MNFLLKIFLFCTRTYTNIIRKTRNAHKRICINEWWSRLVIRCQIWYCWRREPFTSRTTVYQTRNADFCRQSIITRFKHALSTTANRSLEQIPGVEKSSKKPLITFFDTDVKKQHDFFAPNNINHNKENFWIVNKSFCSNNFYRHINSKISKK